MPDGSRRRVARTAPDMERWRPGPGIRARPFPTCAPRDCRPSEFAPSGLSPFRVRALGPVDPPGSCIALPAPSRPIAPLASPRPNAAPLPLIWMRMPFCTQKAGVLPCRFYLAARLPGLLLTLDFSPRIICVQNGLLVHLDPDIARGKPPQFASYPAGANPWPICPAQAVDRTPVTGRHKPSTARPAQVASPSGASRRTPGAGHRPHARHRTASARHRAGQAGASRLPPVWRKPSAHLPSASRRPHARRRPPAARPAPRGIRPSSAVGRPSGASRRTRGIARHPPGIARHPPAPRDAGQPLPRPTPRRA